MTLIFSDRYIIFKDLGHFLLPQLCIQSPIEKFYTIKIPSRDKSSERGKTEFDVFTN